MDRSEIFTRALSYLGQEPYVFNLLGGGGGVQIFIVFQNPRNIFWKNIFRENKNSKRWKEIFAYICMIQVNQF